MKLLKLLVLSTVLAASGPVRSDSAARTRKRSFIQSIAATSAFARHRAYTSL